MLAGFSLAHLGILSMHNGSLNAVCQLEHWRDAEPLCEEHFANDAAMTACSGPIAAFILVCTNVVVVAKTKNRMT